jgi:tol-pal system protein YbgF
MKRPIIIFGIVLAMGSHSLFARAPIIDDSDNFVITQQGGGVDERPLAKEDTPIVNNTQMLSQNNSVDMLSTVKRLEQDIQALQGQLELQSHEIQQLKSQQLAFYKDLDARISPSIPSKTIATTTTKTAPTVSTTSMDAPPSSIPTSHFKSDTDAYENAYQYIQTKQYAKAILAFGQLMTQFPKSSYISNAYYWQGESQLALNHYDEAISAFNIVIQRFGSSNKAEASQLKLGYALLAKGNVPAGKEALKQVIRHYPDTQSAQLAAVKLKSV